MDVERRQALLSTLRDPHTQAQALAHIAADAKCWSTFTRWAGGGGAGRAGWVGGWVKLWLKLWPM